MQGIDCAVLMARGVKRGLADAGLVRLENAVGIAELIHGADGRRLGTEKRISMGRPASIGVGITSHGVGNRTTVRGCNSLSLARHSVARGRRHLLR